MTAGGSPIVRVIKVGGSLLDCSDFTSDLKCWLDAQTPAHNILVVGGGELANAIRKADRLHGLGEETAHGLCLEALRVTARLVAALLPKATLVDDYRQLGREDALTVFDGWSFLHDDEPSLPGTCLPKNWDVTSDSIAGRLAITMNADELVLLKSTLPVDASLLETFCKSGLVDRFFSQLMDELPPVRAVNLRDLAHPEIVLTRVTA